MMARGKVQIRRIENPVHRQVCFCKRRMSLLKKAGELSVLCDAEIGVMVFSHRGKVYEFATNGNLQGLIERYKRSNMEAQGQSSQHNKSQVIQQEVLLPVQETDLLRKGLRYLYGSSGMEHMDLDELQALESYLGIWVHNIRSTKVHIMSMEIEVLKNQEGILKATNDMLQERMIEQSRILDTGNHMMIPRAVLFQENHGEWPPLLG